MLTAKMEREISNSDSSFRTCVPFFFLSYFLFFFFNYIFAQLKWRPKEAWNLWDKEESEEMARFKASLEPIPIYQAHNVRIYLSKWNEEMKEEKKHKLDEQQKWNAARIFFAVLRFKLDKFVENHQVMNKVEMKNWARNITTIKKVKFHRRATDSLILTSSSEL